MKKTKLTAAILSAVMIGSTVSAVPAYAIGMSISGEENLTNAYSDWDIIEDFDLVDYFKYNGGTNVFSYDYAFLRTNANDQNAPTFTINALNRMSDSILITAPSDVNVLKGAGLSDIDKDLVFDITDIPKGGGECTYIITTKNEDNSISAQTAKQIYANLGDSVTRFELTQKSYDVTWFSVQDLLSFRASSETEFNSVYDKLSSFAAENNIDAKVERSVVKDEKGAFSPISSTVKIVPNGAMTGLERIALIKDIYASTGLVIAYEVPEQASSVPGNAIDIRNSVAGDANNDGNTDIADAVLIMQHLANPEKYPITYQGAFNADIVGDDGVTGLDALEIQKMEARSK